MKPYRWSRSPQRKRETSCEGYVFLSHVESTYITYTTTMPDVQKTNAAKHNGLVKLTEVYF